MCWLMAAWIVNENEWSNENGNDAEEICWKYCENVVLVHNTLQRNGLCTFSNTSTSKMLCVNVISCEILCQKSYRFII